MVCGDVGNSEVARSGFREVALWITNSDDLAACVALVPRDVSEARPSAGA